MSKDEQIEALAGAIEAQLSEQEDGTAWAPGVITPALLSVLCGHIQVVESMLDKDVVECDGCGAVGTVSRVTESE